MNIVYKVQNFVGFQVTILLEDYSKVDSFKRSSEIKNNTQFEVAFLPSYAQNERNLSEFNLANMVRGAGFEPTNR